MKKIFYALMLSLAVVVGCSEEYDDSALVGRMEQIEKENDALDAALSSLMERIAAAEEAVENLEKAAAAQDYVTSVVASEDGKGVIVSFKTAESIFIPLDLDASQVDGVVVAKVTVGENEAVFEYTDGTTVTLPLYKAQEFALVLDAAHLTVNAGETVKIAYSVTGATENTVVDVLATSAGYVAKVVESNVEVTVPKPFVDGSVLVWADNGDGKTSIKKVSFEENSISVEAVAEVPAEGGSVVIKGVSNVEVAAEVVEGADWLTAAPAAKAEFSFEFTAAANEGEARTAKVALKTAAGAVLYTVEVAQASGVKPFATLLWSKSSGANSDPWWTGLLTDGVENMDRTATTDGEYVYVSKTGAGVTGIYAIEIANPSNYKMVDMTGVEGGYFPTSCVRTIKNPATGKYILLACAMGMNAYEKVNIYAWENGIESPPTVLCSTWSIPDWASRRFGDFFTVCGDWSKGELWFRSQSSCTVARYSIIDGVLQNPGSPDGFGDLATDIVAMGSVYRYSMSASNVLIVTPDVAKFVGVNDGVDVAWNSSEITFNKCYGFTPFTSNGKNYIAYTRMDTAAKGRLIIIEDELGTADGFQSALEANKIVYESPLHNTEITLSCWSGQTMANCSVCEKDGVTYIMAHQQNVGVSVFKLN